MQLTRKMYYQYCGINCNTYILTALTPDHSLVHRARTAKGLGLQLREQEEDNVQDMFYFFGNTIYTGCASQDSWVFFHVSYTSGW